MIKYLVEHSAIVSIGCWDDKIDVFLLLYIEMEINSC